MPLHNVPYGRDKKMVELAWVIVCIEYFYIVDYKLEIRVLIDIEIVVESDYGSLLNRKIYLL